MKKGFSLIELIVVIGIIGILASIVVGSGGKARDKTADAKMLASLRELQRIGANQISSDGKFPLLLCGNTGNNLFYDHISDLQEEFNIVDRPNCVVGLLRTTWTVEVEYIKNEREYCIENSGEIIVGKVTNNINEHSSGIAYCDLEVSL